MAASAHEVDGGVLQTTVREARATRSASELTVPTDVLRATPRTGAVDLLRAVPGLVATQHSGEGKAHQLFLRGFDAVHGQDVELNVAGLPVNDVSHLHAQGYADLNWLIPEAVREVRVTEGSSRAWQGDFAVAGTVRYELGLDEPGVTAAASVGSFRRARMFLGLKPLADNESFGAVELVRGDGFGPQRAFSRASALGHVVVPLDAVTVRAVVASSLGRFESPGVMREDLQVGFFDALAAHQGGLSARHQGLVGLEFRDEGSKTTAEVYGVWSSLLLKNNFTGFFSSLGDGLEQQHRVGLVGARLEHHRHVSLFGRSFSLDGGLGVRRDGIDQRQAAFRDDDGATLEPTVDANVVQSAGNAWVELGLTLDAWRFMLGGRADALGFDVVDRLGRLPRRAFGVHVGAKAAVERRFGSHLRVHLNYGDGFRSPQARSLADGELAPFVSVRSAELGGVLTLERLEARLVGFGSSVDDDVFFDHTVGTTVRVGPTLRGGLSAHVTARPLDGWVVSASATAATAHLTSTLSLLPYFAPLVGRLDSGYSREHLLARQRLRWSVGLGVTALGPRPLPFGDLSRPVVLVDVRATLRLGFVELAVDVQNLFDARWRDGEFTYASAWQRDGRASLLPARHFTAGTPLSVLVTVELHR